MRHLDIFWKKKIGFCGYPDFFARVREGKVYLPKSVRGIAKEVRKLLDEYPSDLCSGKVWIFPEIVRGDDVLHVRFDASNGKILRYWKPLPTAESWEINGGFIVPYAA